MKVALTGASGFIGSVTARLLAAHGHSVVAQVRETSRRDHIEDCVSEFVVGDQGDERAWRELADASEAIIHNSVDWKPLPKSKRDHDARRNFVNSLDMLEETAPLPFVFVSTIAVHHDMRPRWDGQPDEDHPLRPSMSYGAYKAAVEAFLWSEHFGKGRKTAAVRPCGVYGVDPKLDRSHGHALLKKIANGQDVTKAGGGKFVHVDDVAAAIVACVERDEAGGQAYNLVDCYARWGDWGVMGCEVLGFEVGVDQSSPATPENVFSKEKAKGLVRGDSEFLERGHAGIRAHLEALAAAMRAAGDI